MNRELTVMDESHFVKIDGQAFTCSVCGSNVFHYDLNPPVGYEWHVCNGCDTTYQSEEHIGVK
jgi:hypothetical protein